MNGIQQSKIVVQGTLDIIQRIRINTFSRKHIVYTLRLNFQSSCKFRLGNLLFKHHVLDYLSDVYITFFHLYEGTN